jgi:hypothetical protein
MGTLTYAGNAVAAFDDRTLWHVQSVLLSKLRRREIFTMTWDVEIDGAPARNTIVISDSIPLQFTYSATESIPLNREWIEQMVVHMNSTGNLRLIVEPKATSLTATASPAVLNS